MPFQIEVKPQQVTDGITAGFPPYFEPMIEASFQIYVGEAWQYLLPGIVDPQEAEVSLTVDLSSAAIFTELLEPPMFLIKKGATKQAGAYKLKVTLTNTIGFQKSYQIDLNITEKTVKIETTNTSNTK